VKKILFLLTVFAAFSVNAKSQSVISTTLISQYSNSIDTVDNTETLYLSLPSTTQVKGHFKTVLVVFKTQEISGTGGGTATLEVSANGTDYAAAPGQTAYTIVDQTAVQTSAWKITDFEGAKLRNKSYWCGNYVVQDIRCRPV
jgi:hypothetical protein